MIRLRPSGGEGRVFLRWKEVPLVCPTRSEAKHTETLETGAEKGFLQGHVRKQGCLCPKKFSAPQSVLVAQSCLTLCDPWTVAHQAPLSVGFSSKNTGVGCHSPLQAILLTQGLNLGLLHCRQILYRLSHQELPKGF